MVLFGPGAASAESCTHQARRQTVMFSTNLAVTSIKRPLAKSESRHDILTCKSEWFSMIPSGHLSMGFIKVCVSESPRMYLNMIDQCWYSSCSFAGDPTNSKPKSTALWRSEFRKFVMLSCPLTFRINMSHNYTMVYAAPMLQSLLFPVYPYFMHTNVT